MPGEVTNHGEKPIHYTYLKEFRTQQCPDFLQHKCAHHRPYTCFNWHFLNQKRRRPIRKKDGSFNYSPDIYCSKYDETSGICPDGDECPLLHRIAGDVERRYHLRYFKTCPCVYETDSRGQCSKNGPHCAFAHGMDDLRQPVYDCHDLERMLDGQKATEDGSNDLLSSSLEKDMLYNEDPVWNDPNYVLAHYKTEICRRPHRLCRQGYACPSFHNSRDKRRSPKTHKYRSTPCPNVKHGDEWGDPPQCENGDNCTYCHTRTEQQFHPEIYKSTKCNDMMQTGYCPRGQFCAFAHIEKELSAQWDVFSAGETSLAEFVENVLPLSDQATNSSEHGDLPGGKQDDKDKLNGCRKLSADAVANCASIWQPSRNSPGLNALPEPIGKRRTVSLSEGSSFGQFKLHASDKEERQSLMKHHMQMLDARLTIDTNDAINNIGGGRAGHPLLNNFIANNSGNFPGIGSTPSTPLSSNMSPHATPFYPGEDTVESVIVSALDEELGLGGLNLSSYDKDNEDSNSVCSSLSASFPSFGSYFGSHSVPMSIPAATDYQQLASSFGGSFGQSIDTTSFGSFTLGSLHSQQSKLEQMLKRPCGSSSLFGEVGSGSYPGYGSSSSGMQGASGFKPGTSSQTNPVDVQRLKEELAMNQMKLAKWEEGIQQARFACEAWRKEMEDSNNRARKADEERQLAIKQRDDALTLATALKQELESLKRGAPLLHCLQGVGELDRLSEQSLQAIQSQLQRDLETVEKKLSSLLCAICNKPAASLVSLSCNHHMCHLCIQKARKCPMCHVDVSRGAEAPGTM